MILRIPKFPTIRPRKKGLVNELTLFLFTSRDSTYRGYIRMREFLVIFEKNCKIL